jgi:hypothetical protein
LMEAQIQESTMHRIPQVVFSTATQPTTRGGPRNFVAGNIRIVNDARGLLHPSDQSDSYWRNLLMEEWNLNNFNEPQDASEALIIPDPIYYICPRCAGFL